MGMYAYEYGIDYDVSVNENWKDVCTHGDLVKKDISRCSVLVKFLIRQLFLPLI